MPTEAVRKTSRSPTEIAAFSARTSSCASCSTRLASVSDRTMTAKESPVQARQRVLRTQQPATKRRANGKQDGVADRVAELGVDALEIVDVEDDHDRRRRAVGLCPRKRGFQPVEEELPVGKAGQVVVMASWSSRSSAILTSVMSAIVPVQRMTSPSDPTIGRAFRQNQRIVPVLGAHAEGEVDPTAPLVDDGVQDGAEQVALARMDQAQPVARRARRARRA